MGESALQVSKDGECLSTAEGVVFDVGNGRQKLGLVEKGVSWSS